MERDEETPEELRAYARELRETSRQQDDERKEVYIGGANALESEAERLAKQRTYTPLQLLRARRDANRFVRRTGGKFRSGRGAFMLGAHTALDAFFFALGEPSVLDERSILDDDHDDE